jgi:hypothetical protein
MNTDAVLSFEEAMEKYDPVLGFEVHVELNTKTKMFSSAPNVFGDEPNTNVNEVDLGMPGVLPVVNKAAIESSIKIGLALNCKIAESCRFARKNYFYPDTPKNFQTSQYDEPIAYDGYLDIELSDGTCSAWRLSAPTWKRTPENSPTWVVPRAVSRAPTTRWWTTTVRVFRWWKSSPSPSRAPVAVRLSWPRRTSPQSARS